MKKELFGLLPDGREVYAYTFGNSEVNATVLNYGGVLQKLNVDGKDVVCGFDDVNGYIESSGSHAILVGRYANRICDGKFTLDGKEYILAKNEKGITHLHGGNNGFGKRLWNAFCEENGNTSILTLTLFSPDGDEGYPGNLVVSVKYIICGRDLIIDYSGKSDSNTILNMTHHAYFNLNGYASGSAMGHSLQLFSELYSEVDEKLIPKKIAHVENTPFDFREGKLIGKDIDLEDEQLSLGSGYDHNFYINSNEYMNFDGRHLAKGAVLKGEKLTMEMYTDKPCVQLYTANHMCHPYPMKNNVKQEKRSAVCLETQFAPDSPNHNGSVLKAGEEYKYTTIFRFI